MATVMAHTILGSGVIAAPLRAAGVPRWALNLGTIYGAVFGSLPDTVPWLAARLFSADEFTIKTWMYESAPWYLAWQPPYKLHVWLDSYFHVYVSWWAKLWWLEILMWIVGAGLIWYTYRKDDRG